MPKSIIKTLKIKLVYYLIKHCLQNIIYIFK
jgi:hypothetical protein